MNTSFRKRIYSQSYLKALFNHASAKRFVSPKELIIYPQNQVLSDSEIREMYRGHLQRPVRTFYDVIYTSSSEVESAKEQLPIPIHEPCTLLNKKRKLVDSVEISSSTADSAAKRSKTGPEILPFKPRMTRTTVQVRRAEQKALNLKRKEKFRLNALIGQNAITIRNENFRLQEALIAQNEIAMRNENLRLREALNAQNTIMHINDPMDLDDDLYSAGVGQLNIPVAERKILKPRRRFVAAPRQVQATKARVVEVPKLQPFQTANVVVEAPQPSPVATVVLEAPKQPDSVKFDMPTISLMAQPSSAPVKVSPKIDPRRSPVLAEAIEAPKQQPKPAMDMPQISLMAQPAAAVVTEAPKQQLQPVIDMPTICLTPQPTVSKAARPKLRPTARKMALVQTPAQPEPPKEPLVYTDDEANDLLDEIYGPDNAALPKDQAPAAAAAQASSKIGKRKMLKPRARLARASSSQANSAQGKENVAPAQPEALKDNDDSAVNAFLDGIIGTANFVSPKDQAPENRPAASALDILASAAASSSSAVEAPKKKISLSEYLLSKKK